MASEAKHLLSEEQNSDVSTEDYETTSSSRELKKRFLRCGILLQILLIVIYSSMTLLFIRLYPCNEVTSLHPINGLAIKYQPQIYTDFEESEFAGSPSPSVDKAWHDLLAKITIRVTAAELEYSNQTSVELPEGGGYMAWLGVYHQLHCIVGPPSDK
ncbi:hypothetical protein ACMFMG_012152 [Clarireedia jacksonii]